MVEISAIGNPALFFRASEVNSEDTALQAASNAAAAEDLGDQNIVNAAGEEADVGGNAFKALATVESLSDDDGGAEKPRQSEGRKESSAPIPGSFSQQSLRGLAGDGAVSPQTAREIQRHGVPPSVQARVVQLSIQISAERHAEIANDDIIGGGLEALNNPSTSGGELKASSSVPNEGTALVPPGTHFATQV